MRVMMIRVSMTAIGMILAASGAGAQDTPPEKPAAEKKICRADAETGSILARRRCFTRTQWAEIERKSGKHNAKDVDRFGDAIRTTHGLGPNR